MNASENMEIPMHGNI